jgi:hypothetical protein
VKNDLRDIITALDVSRVTLQRIYWNYVFAMAYNVLAMPIAAGVTFIWWRWRLPPEVAALSMAMSSVSVIVSSLLLKRYRKPVVAHVDLMRMLTRPSDITNLLFCMTVCDVGMSIALASAAKLVTQPEEPHDACCSCGQCNCPSPVPRAKNGYSKLDAALELQELPPLKSSVPHSSTSNGTGSGRSRITLTLPGSHQSNGNGSEASSSAAAHCREGTPCVCGCKDCRCKKKGTLAQPLAPHAISSR